MSHAVLPSLVPARMLNEYVYCPRLFFLEWVERLWAPNADTEEGNFQHRRVDSAQGAAPLPHEGTLKQAWSLELSSEKLGITAKLDLTEGTKDGGVIPVDTKKGRPTDEGGTSEPDAIQVCAQVLLLREHGYLAKHGEIFYAATKQRVRVEITDDLIARTLQVVTRARELATRLSPPPPLQSSPKCGRCSLASICMPDELNVLAGRTQTKPRRLIAAAPDAHPIYVTEQGSVVGVDGGRIVITKYRQELASVRLIDILHVSTWGNVQISTQALRTFFDHQIDVFYFSYGGWLTGTSSVKEHQPENPAIRSRRTP